MRIDFSSLLLFMSTINACDNLIVKTFYAQLSKIILSDYGD